MNIYLISQDQNNDYDTYDSAVVVANNEDEARNFHPSVERVLSAEEWEHFNFCGSWCTDPKHVTVEYLGKYEGDDKNVHIECASFNAG